MRVWLRSPGPWPVIPRPYRVRDRARQDRLKAWGRPNAEPFLDLENGRRQKLPQGFERRRPATIFLFKSPI